MLLMKKLRFSKLIFSFFDLLLNSIVYELYFKVEFHSAGKEVLKHLGDLSPISDNMSPEQKLAIIQNEFERLLELKSYYRLSGYWYRLLADKQNHVFNMVQVLRQPARCTSLTEICVNGSSTKWRKLKLRSGQK
jgi:hypothetical protein